MFESFLAHPTSNPLTYLVSLASQIQLLLRPSSRPDPSCLFTSWLLQLAPCLSRWFSKQQSESFLKSFVMSYPYSEPSNSFPSHLERNPRQSHGLQSPMWSTPLPSLPLWSSYPHRIPLPMLLPAPHLRNSRAPVWRYSSFCVEPSAANLGTWLVKQLSALSLWSVSLARKKLHERRGLGLPCSEAPHSSTVSITLDMWIIHETKN